MTEAIGFMSAVERDDQKRLQQLLVSNKDKQSIAQLAKCLHMASLWGRQECVDILLEAGTLANIHDINGNTPLIVAVRQDHVNIVKTLIEAKSNVNKATHLAHATPLHYAVSNGSLRCARLLVDAGADVETRTSSGRTPLMLACRSGHDAAVQLLIKAGANLDKTDNDRAVALHFAAEENSIECVRQLLNAGAKANLLTKNGDSALGLAARKGNLEVVELLIKNQSESPTEYKRCNMSALHWASEAGNLECTRLLIAHHSSAVNVATRQLYSRGDFLAAKGVTALMLASRGGHRSVLQLLLDHGAQIDSTDSDGMTALLHATIGDHWQCMESLLRAGADVDGVAATSDGQAISPLLTAISGRCFSAIRLLLRANCSMNKMGRLRLDDDPMLPMMLASRQQEDDFIEILRSLAIAECQNPDFFQFSSDLIEIGCENSDPLKFLVLCSSVSTPVSLARIARHRIRQTIGRGLFHQVAALPLPIYLQRFILLDELEEDSRGY